MIIFIIILFLFTGYSIFILYYWLSWKSIPDFIDTNNIHHTTISVIIPARNEEENISSLLLALQSQTFPKNLFEVIVVDDHSEDETAEIIRKFPEVKLIQLNSDEINSYKKKAIETGIANAKNEWIVTTDADCLPPPKWLEMIASFKEKNNSVFIAAPVVFQNDSSVLQVFQALDFLILQGITGVAVTKNLMSMCNGANLAYEKKVFYEVNSFENIDHIASGDDMLLMHKIVKKLPQQVHYLKSKEAIVTTQPMKTWKDFFNQRIRWASKANQYDDKRIFWVLLLVYFFNLSFLALFIAGFWNYHFWICLIGLWFAKTIIEFPFVNSVAVFFGKKSLLKHFFFFQPLHIVYTIVAGLLGQLGKYEWKGRKVK